MPTIDYASIIHAISVYALPALFAITFHEAAHGLVAYHFGDDTAWRMGRVTANPLRHIDPFGTIIMPLLLALLSQGRFFFGYAKPVPVNFSRLRHPRIDMVWVALAGPGTNIILAIASALLLYVLPYVPDVVYPWLRAVLLTSIQFNILLAIVSALLAYVLPFLPAVGFAWARDNLLTSIWFNILLAVFNMIPLPPLDGGRVAVGLLPDALAFPLARLERYGLLIIVGLLIVVPMIGERLNIDLNILAYVIGVPAQFVLEHILRLAPAWFAHSPL